MPSTYTLNRFIQDFAYGANFGFCSVDFEGKRGVSSQETKRYYNFFQNYIVKYFRRRLNIKIHVVKKNPGVFKLVPKLKRKSKFEAPAYFTEK